MTFSQLSLSQIEDLAEAAIAFETARRIAANLKAARNGCRCEQAGADEPEVGASGTDPCWKQWQDVDDDRERLDEEQWCATCRHRQRLHEAYRKAMKTRGARRRVFQRHALKAIDPEVLKQEAVMADDEPRLKTFEGRTAPRQDGMA